MTEKKRVVYRGVSMIKGWPEKIAAAQNIPSFILDGHSVSRISYGAEKNDWGAERQPCDDCRVIKGEFHVPGCDIEECPVCHDQLISCECSFEDSSDLDW